MYSSMSAAWHRHDVSTNMQSPQPVTNCLSTACPAASCRCNAYQANAVVRPIWGGRWMVTACRAVAMR
jgi:hypothetical protein